MENRRWIDFEHLMKRWDCGKLELSEIIYYDLTAYTFRDSSEVEHLSDGDKADLDNWGFCIGALLEDETFVKILSRDDIKRLYQLNSFQEILFRLPDVAKFENENPEILNKKESPMDGKEKKELGQLRKMKKKWDDSIKAAVHIGIFLWERKENRINKRPD